jgi:hypothetical protein
MRDSWRTIRHLKKEISGFARTFLDDSKPLFGLPWGPIVTAFGAAAKYLAENYGAPPVKEVIHEISYAWLIFPPILAWLAVAYVFRYRKFATLAKSIEIPVRISFVRFAKIANDEYGWDLKIIPRWQSFDFTEAVRQAARDGVSIHGRKNCQNLTPLTSRNRVLVPIPQLEWDRLGIDIRIDGEIIDSENFEITARLLGDKSVYWDLYIASEASARAWLA